MAVLPYQQWVSNTNYKTLKEIFGSISFKKEPYHFIKPGLQIEYKYDVLKIYSYTPAAAENYYLTYKKEIDKLVPIATTVVFLEKVQPVY